MERFLRRALLCFVAVAVRRIHAKHEELHAPLALHSVRARFFKLDLLHRWLCGVGLWAAMRKRRAESAATGAVFALPARQSNPRSPDPACVTVFTRTVRRVL